MNKLIRFFVGVVLAIAGILGSTVLAYRMLEIFHGDILLTMLSSFSVVGVSLAAFFSGAVMIYASLTTPKN